MGRLPTGRSAPLDQNQPPAVSWAGHCLSPPPRQIIALTGLGPRGRQGWLTRGRLRWPPGQAGDYTRPGDAPGGNTSLTVMTAGPHSEHTAPDAMGRRGPSARIRRAPKLTPPDHPSADRQEPYGVRAGRAHSPAAGIEEVASRLGAGGPRPEAPGPCLIPMALLECTRAGHSANHGRWGRGEPSAGNRKYEIGVVEVMGLQMILTGLVGLVAGGGRVSWRVGVPGVSFGVIFLAIGAASARRAASAAKGTGCPTIGARGR